MSQEAIAELSREAAGGSSIIWRDLAGADKTLGSNSPCSHVWWAWFVNSKVEVDQWGGLKMQHGGKKSSWVFFAECSLLYMDINSAFQIGETGPLRLPSRLLSHRGSESWESLGWTWLHAQMDHGAQQGRQLDLRSLLPFLTPTWLATENTHWLALLSTRTSCAGQAPVLDSPVQFTEFGFYSEE